MNKRFQMQGGKNWILQTGSSGTPKAGSLKRNTALEYSTRVVQEGGRRCKKSTLNDLVHLTPLRIPLMNPPSLARNLVKPLMSLNETEWRGAWQCNEL